MELLVRVVWIGALVNLAHSDPKIFIAAPNIIHVDVAESVAIQVDPKDAPSGAAKIEVFFENQKTMKSCSEIETFALDASNGYIQVKKLKISAQQVKLCGIEDLKRKKYIQLVAKGDFLTKVRKVPILLSTKKGYLFIQTDKPIYTPTQHVKIRVFPLDHVMRPLQESVTITVYNVQGIQVKKVEKQPDKSMIINEQIDVPDIASPGVWTITAKFSSSPETSSTAQFEVKKYVLPNFEVKILPDKPYFLLTEEACFDFIVEARYIYGESVKGVTYVRFAIMNEDGTKMFLRGTEQQITLEDGKAPVRLKMQNVAKAFNLTQPLAALTGTRLYIAATVLEVATGELEEQELSTVTFVTSPYVLDFSKTQRYFVPGAPFKVLVAVSHTDGSLAAQASVTLARKVNGKLEDPQSTKKSDDRGAVIDIINTPATARTLEILATVGSSSNSETSTFTASAYQSSSQSYLNIMVMSPMVLKPSEKASFNLIPVTSQAATISFLYYMVLSKGQILFLKRVSRSSTTNIQFDVTGDMIPSFRMVAYYYLGEEIVTNSVWMDVEDSCDGKLHVKTESGLRQPGQPLKLTIETDDQASVAMAAVDSAVYILNKKNKLTPNKVFQAMNEYDLGCTVGNGKDFKGVFDDAGLSFISSQSYSEVRQGYGCETQPRRKKRTLELQMVINKKSESFTNPRLKECCKSGMKLLPPGMNLNCVERSARVRELKCKEAFLDCCNFAKDQRKKFMRMPGGLGRVQEQPEDEDFEDEESIQARTDFPESWLWKTWDVNKKREETIHLPDSITTWEIQAIRMSKGRGFCIAEPVQVKVFKTFHIYLPLPYSVKRFEQLEIHPTLYNYAPNALEVNVFLDRSEGLCSPATSGERKKTTVVVPPNSAMAVPFSIIPMMKQKIPITVTAQGTSDGSFSIGDKVTKNLMIVSEGVTRHEENTYELDTKDPKGGKIEILGKETSNLTPDSTVTINVRVSADVSVETVNNSLAAGGISRLIRVPRGCAEQTMFYMAPGVYAMKYLDETEQWTSLGPERKDEALATMQDGYTRILTYRKEDGSYGAWLTTPSSTWLTAFVAKILSISRDHITVDEMHIQTAVEFVMKQQVESSGAFRDPAPIYHREMQGGVGGSEGEVSLTAFVTIALHHALVAHTGPSKTKLRKSLEKAGQYLQQKLPGLKSPFTVAIAAYALNLVSDNESVKNDAHKYLMDFATVSKDGKKLYWEIKDEDRLASEAKRDRVPNASAITVEGTAFALMHILLQDDIPTANKIVTWLTEQQNYGGGFKSTQDTVVALEALSQYWIKTYSNEGANLEITITSPARKSLSKKIKLDKNNKQVQELLQLSLGNDVHVDVKGKGKGTLTIMKLYNVMQVENNTCQHLKLDVEVTEDPKDPVTSDDNEDYDYKEDENNDEPFPRIHWQDLRRRRRRQAGSDGGEKKKVVGYKVCLWRDVHSKLSGMGLVDITMLSGFEPTLEDLNTLKDEVDSYISHYEYTHGRLHLYFETVPIIKECIAFRAFQSVKVGALQPASATLYDFYEPDRKCNIFYNLPSRSSLVSAMCTDEVCQCAEGTCPRKKKTLDINEAVDPRQAHACYSPRVEYGYKAKVIESAEENAFVVYKVEITEVLQRSKDDKITAGDQRNFIKRKSCKMQLDKGAEYLLMGKDGSTFDNAQALQYLLETTTWIEELGGGGRCKATNNRKKCDQATKFMEGYRLNGCMV